MADFFSAIKNAGNDIARKAKDIQSTVSYHASGVSKSTGDLFSSFLGEKSTVKAIKDIVTLKSDSQRSVEKLRKILDAQKDEIDVTKMKENPNFVPKETKQPMATEAEQAKEKSGIKAKLASNLQKSVEGLGNGLKKAGVSRSSSNSDQGRDMHAEKRSKSKDKLR